MIQDDGSARLEQSATEYRKNVLAEVKRLREGAAGREVEALGAVLDGLAARYEQMCVFLAAFPCEDTGGRTGWDDLVVRMLDHPARGDEQRREEFGEFISDLARSEIPLPVQSPSLDVQLVWLVMNEAYWLFTLIASTVLVDSEIDPPDRGATLEWLLAQIEGSNYQMDLMTYADAGLPGELRDRAAVRLTGLVVNHLRTTTGRLGDAIRKSAGEENVSQRTAALSALFNAVIEIGESVPPHIPLVAPKRSPEPGKATAGRGRTPSLVSRVGKAVVASSSEGAAHPGILLSWDREGDNAESVPATDDTERAAMRAIHEQYRRAALAAFFGNGSKRAKKLVDTLLVWCAEDAERVEDVCALLGETDWATYKRLERLRKLPPELAAVLKDLIKPP